VLLLGGWGLLPLPVMALPFSIWALEISRSKSTLPPEIVTATASLLSCDLRAIFLAFARTFAQRRLAAAAIFALPAADNARFLMPVSSRLAEPPNAFAAARTPLNW